MLFVIFVVFWRLRLSVCSEVVDKATQAGIYIDEYCPKMPYCAEGAHTMCMFYNPAHPYGPRCHNYQNISITYTVADTLLDLVNEMRGVVAMGKETGQGNVLLPRAYGMFKLKWDNELATFAQVLANTCVLRIDLCRATKRFDAPGQLASLVRFTIPDWLPVLHRQKFTDQGLTSPKIEYAAKEACKSWYQQKQHVTLAMLNSTPNWLEHPSRTQGKQYLQLIDGRATHMGCGVSGYSEYAYHGNEIIYNAIEVICNFSTSPRQGTAVFRTTNKDEGCGCPDNYDHDDRCLCTNPKKKIPERTCGKDKNCKPAVVLLPIFTVEDAPQHKLLRKERRTNSNCEHCKNHKKHNSISTIISASDLEHHEEQEQPTMRKWNQNEVVEYTHEPTNEAAHVKYKRVDLGFEISKSLSQDNRTTKNVDIHNIKTNSANHVSRRFHGNNEKQSIFSRSPKFELHNGKTNAKQEIIKPDVTPRKFSDTQKILDSYLNGKKKVTVQNFFKKSGTKKFDVIPRFKTNKTKHSSNSTDHATTKTHLVKLNRDKSPRTSKPLKSKISHNDFENEDSFIKSSDEADKKLMTLLDTLEQEVKHIELDKSEKDVFDVKLRKIYDTVVGSHTRHKPKARKFSDSDEQRENFKDNALKSDNIRDITFSDYENNDYQSKKNSEKVFTDTEDRVSNLNRDNNYPKSIYAQPSDTDIFNRKLERANFENDVERYSETENTDDQSLVLKSDTDYKSKESDRDTNVRSVPFQADLVNRQEQSDSSIHIRNEMEIDKPRIHFRGEDLEKRDSFIPRVQYQSDNSDRKRILKYPNNFYIGKRSEFKFDDDKDRNLNSIDEPRVRYEEDIRQTDKLNERPKNYYDKNEDPINNSMNNNRKEYEEDLLDEDRRKFYQNKLNSLQRKIRKSDDKRYRNNHEFSRQRRLTRRRLMDTVQGGLDRSRGNLERVRSRENRLGVDRLASPANDDRFKPKYYVPDRARALHNF